MYLDYSTLQFDSFGRPEKPELILQTMAGRTIGVLPGVSNLKFNIKFSEPSEMTFDISAKLDADLENPMYDEVRGYRLIYTNHYGIYIIMSPTTDNDGLLDKKSVTCYSIEKQLGTKRFFLEEGTFKFYNKANPYDEDTIMGRILEIVNPHPLNTDSGWTVASVADSVAARYRTFTEYNDNLSTFITDTAAEKFRCVFVFEPYEKTITVYDADAEREMLPIYLSYDNLVKSVKIDELSDELKTAISPYGSDDLDVRAVNPIGTNWLYNVSYFIEKGDIERDLGAKFYKWQRAIMAEQMDYRAIVALRATATTKLLIAQAELVDIQGEMDALIGLQTVAIEAQALETKDSDGYQAQQNRLANIHEEIEQKRAEITAQNTLIESLQSERDAYADDANSIVERLKFTNYFEEDEQDTLAQFFIEDTLTEETFVATDVDPDIDGAAANLRQHRTKRRIA